MEKQKIIGCPVAILATHGFEQSELLVPLKELRDAGAEVKIVSLQGGEIRGWKDKDWGDSVRVDLTLDEARAEDFEALLIPGGVMNPDLLRAEASAVDFVKDFVSAGKPIASICHGPQLLIETGMVRGRKLTSYHSIRTDLINAGAEWVDEEVVTDMGLVTSRKPDDLPAFCKKMLEEFAEGRHDRQAQRLRGAQRTTGSMQM